MGVACIRSRYKKVAFYCVVMTWWVIVLGRKRHVAMVDDVESSCVSCGTMKNTERIAWGVGLAVAMVWGISRSPSAKEESAKPANVSEVKAERFRSSSRLEMGSENGRRMRGGDEHGSSTGDAGRVLRQGDPLQRASGFLRMLAACDANGLEEMRASFDELKAAGIALPAEEGWLDFRAGQLQGAELLDARKGTSRDMEELPKLAKVFEGWVHEDPYAAGYWLDGLQPGKFKDRMAMVHIAASAKDDPSAALKHASALHPSQRGIAGKEVAIKLAETLSPQEASSVLDAMKTGAGEGNETYMSNLFDGIMTRAASGDVSAAMSLAEAHAGQPYANGSAMARVSAALAKEDPVKALEWAAKINGQQAETGSLFSGAIKGMSLEGLDQAEDWVATRQGQLPESLVAEIDRQRKVLEDRGGDRGAYDRED